MPFFSPQTHLRHVQEKNPPHSAPTAGHQNDKRKLRNELPAQFLAPTGHRSTGHSRSPETTLHRTGDRTALPAQRHHHRPSRGQTPQRSRQHTRRLGQPPLTYRPTHKKAGPYPTKYSGEPRTYSSTHTANTNILPIDTAHAGRRYNPAIAQPGTGADMGTPNTYGEWHEPVQVPSAAGAITEIDASLPGDRATFERLTDEWLEQRPRGVDVAQMIKHPAYQAIIDIGPDAVPWLLVRLGPTPRPLVPRPQPDHRCATGTTRTSGYRRRDGPRLDHLGQAAPVTGTKCRLTKPSRAWSLRRSQLSRRVPARQIATPCPTHTSRVISWTDSPRPTQEYDHDQSHHQGERHRQPATPDSETAPIPPPGPAVPVASLAGSTPWPPSSTWTTTPSRP